MRRIVVFILLLLALGFVTSIAVAWGLAATPVNGDPWSNLRYTRHNGWFIQSAELVGRRLHVLSRDDGYDGKEKLDERLMPSLWSIAHTEPPKRSWAKFREFAFGWPLLCLEHRNVPSESWVFADHYEDGLVAAPANIVNRVRQPMPRREYEDDFDSTDQYGNIALPFAPIWGSMLGNTAFWAFAWLIATTLAALPWRLRGWNRRRQGACPRCGYIVKHTEAVCCSECGWDRRSLLPWPARSSISVLSLTIVVFTAGVVVASIYVTSQVHRDEPIFVAAARNQADAVATLLDQGESVDVVDSFGVSVLYWAIVHNSDDVVKLLVSRGANVQRNTVSNELQRAPILGFPESRFPDPRQTCLQAAAEIGKASIVCCLIQACADPNVTTHYGQSLLHVVIRLSEDAHDKVLCLLDSGADVNAVDDEGRTPLIWASWSGHSQVVHLLLERGADVNAADNYGFTPLHSACTRNSTGITQILVDHGADVHRRDSLGRTPLMHAVGLGEYDAVRALLDAGADASYVDDFGDGVLAHMYWEDADNDLIDMLIDAGACIDCPCLGETPLVLAMNASHQYGIRALIEAGARPHMIEKDEWTPSGFLKWGGYRESILYEVLERFGLDINATISEKHR